MCGVSGVELVVILVIAVVVLGPDRLPELMRTLGRLTREVRKATGELTSVRDEFTRSMRENTSLGEETAARRKSAGAAGQDVAEIDALRARKKALEEHSAQAAMAAAGALAASSSETPTADDGHRTDDEGTADETAVDETVVDEHHEQAEGLVASTAAEASLSEAEEARRARAKAEHEEMMRDLAKLPVQIRPAARAIAAHFDDDEAEDALAVSNKPRATAASDEPSSTRSDEDAQDAGAATGESEASK